MKRDIEDLVASLASLPGITDVGLTTNGLALSRKLPRLQTAGTLLAALWKKDAIRKNFNLSNSAYH